MGDFAVAGDIQTQGVQMVLKSLHILDGTEAQDGAITHFDGSPFECAAVYELAKNKNVS